MLAEVTPEMTRPMKSQRPSAETVGQAAEDRREDKLHQRPGCAEQAENSGRTRRVVVDETFHELWQNRHDQAERQHVEQDREEDERHGRWARWRRRQRKLGRTCFYLFAQDSRLRLWANGLAFSRNEIRTGVPGSSKCSRKELMR